MGEVNAGAWHTDVLRELQRRFHACFGRRSDALFELSDLILTAGAVSSPPHLSLAPVAYRHHSGNSVLREYERRLPSRSA